MIIRHGIKLPIDLQYSASTPTGQILFYKIAFIGVTAILSFTIGLILSGFKSKAPDSISQAEYVGKNRAAGNLFEKSTLLLSISSIVTLLVLFPNFLPAMKASYASAYDTKYHNPLPTFIYEIFYISNAILATLLVIKRKLVCFIVGALLFAGNFFLTFTTFIKAPAVVALLGCGYSYFFLMRNKKIAFSLMFVGIAAILFVLMPMVNIAKSPVARESFAKIFEYYVGNFRFTFMDTDASGPMEATLIAVSDDSHLLLGKTYIDGLSLFIPRILWKDRPLDIAESFARDHVVNWQPGQGMGFGPIAEAYVNFGLYFSFLEFIIFGLLWGVFWRVLQKATSIFNSPVQFDIIYRIVGFYVMVQFFRGFIMGTFKPVIMILFPIMISTFFIYFLQKHLAYKSEQLVDK